MEVPYRRFLSRVTSERASVAAVEACREIGRKVVERIGRRRELEIFRTELREVRNRRIEELDMLRIRLWLSCTFNGKMMRSGGGTWSFLPRISASVL